MGTKPTRGAINALVFQVQNKKIKKSKPMRGAINALVFQVQNKNKTKKRKPTRGAINALVFQLNKYVWIKQVCLFNFCFQFSVDLMMSVSAGDLVLFRP